MWWYIGTRFVHVKWCVLEQLNIRYSSAVYICCSQADLFALKMIGSLMSLQQSEVHNLRAYITCYDYNVMWWFIGIRILHVQCCVVDLHDHNIMCYHWNQESAYVQSAVFLNNWIWCVIQFQVYMTLVVVSSSMFLEGCEVYDLWTSMRVDCSKSYVIHCNQNFAYPVMCSWSLHLGQNVPVSSNCVILVEDRETRSCQPILDAWAQKIW